MKQAISQIAGRVLAIDYGTKRVGLAVSDPLKLVGMPLGNISPRILFDFLRDYCAKEKVGVFILGYPLTLRGEEDAWTREVCRLQNKLCESFPEQQVLLLDERMTSKMAYRALVSMDLRRKQRQQKTHLDPMAATILLNNYLQSQVICN